MIKYEFEVPEMIKGIRKIFQINQTDFCKILGVSQGTVSKLERGVLEPDLKTILNLSNALELDLNIFKEGIITKIPARVVKRNTKCFPPLYTSEKIFSAKTTFIFLELINQINKEDIYKQLRLTREAFLLTSTKFNFNLFLNALEFVNKDAAIKKMNDFKISETRTIDSDELKEFIRKYGDTKIEKLVERNKTIDLSFNIESESFKTFSYYPDFIQSVVGLDMKCEFNIQLEPKKAVGAKSLNLKVYS